MAGVKGRSGRKTTSNESKRLRILDLAWDIIEITLKDKRVSDKEKRNIALELCKKNIPQELEHSGEVNTIINIIKSAPIKEVKIADAPSS